MLLYKNEGVFQPLQNVSLCNGTGHHINQLLCLHVGASTGERKRRWGSTSGRVQLTPHAAISSDTLEDIIPEEVKAESSNQSTALDVVMSYSGDEGDKAANENMERGEEEDVLDIGGKE